MAEQFPEGIVAKAIGVPMTVALGALIGWLTAGPTGVVGSTLMALLSILGGICGLTFSLIYRRYVGVLGASAKRKGSPERQAYDALRNSLAEGGSAARLYALWLTDFLDAVDRFFGDAEMADRTLFPRALGLKAPASLWTAPAFNRCLLLALLYPVATIFVIWTISGHVGPAEAALRLQPDFSGWQRGLLAALLLFVIFALWRFFQTEGWKSHTWLAVACAVVASLAGTVVGGRLVTAVTFVAAAGLFSGVAGVSMVTLISGLAVVGAIAGAGGLAVVVGLTWAAEFASDIAIQHRRQGVFLALFLLAMILACLVGANELASLEGWQLVAGHSWGCSHCSTRPSTGPLWV